MNVTQLELLLNVLIQPIGEKCGKVGSFGTTYDVLQVFSREPQRRLHSLVQI